MTQPTAYLLRGINLGATNRVSMPVLRTVLADELGARGVATHLQSGNVVCTPPEEPEAFAATLAKAVEERFGVRSPVISRSREELAAALDLGPFGELVDDERRYQIQFFDRPLPEMDLSALPINELERVAVSGRDVHIWFGSSRGIHASRLPAALERALPEHTSTGRNLRTVRAVLSLLDDAA